MNNMQKATVLRDAGLEKELEFDTESLFDKFMRLLENHSNFKKTFNYQRKDFQDQSVITYDYAIAMFAIADGWQDDEIKLLLISARRKNNQDYKFDGNDNYYERTIKKARMQYADKCTENDFKQTAKAELSELEKMNRGEMSTFDIIRTLNERLNIEMIYITKYLTDPPQFRLVMRDDKNIMLGDVGNLIGQSAFRKKIAAVAGIFIKTFKQAAWDIIAQLLLSACVEEDMDAESTDSGYITSNIKSYLEVRKVVDDVEVGIAGKRPFYATIEGEQYIQFFGADFRKWFFTSTCEHLAPKSMGILFKSIGLSNKSYKFKSKVYDLWRIDKKSPLYIGQIEKDNFLLNFDEIPSTSLPADLFK